MAWLRDRTSASAGGRATGPATGRARAWAAGRASGWLRRIFGRPPAISTDLPPATPPGHQRGRWDHVILLDGTMSTLEPGLETNIGLLWKLLSEGQVPRRAVYYEAGVQWQSWRDLGAVAQGRGLDAQIRRAYGWLATRYRPGDRIFLFGYSRGAYAARSLSGVIDRLGLLRPEEATVRNIRDAWRHYERTPESATARAFARRHCHPAVEIEMVGVFDTVKALGLRLPLLWLLTETQHEFHDARLGRSIRHGAQALALDETRHAFTPVPWISPEGWPGTVEQVWFRGTHGDIGGQLGGLAAARGLSNIPLVWMLEQAEARGLWLPPDWRARYPQDPGAPSVGGWRGLGRLFLLRSPRVVGRDASERLHPSAQGSPRAARLGLPLLGAVVPRHGAVAAEARGREPAEAEGMPGQ